MRMSILRTEQVQTAPNTCQRWQKATKTLWTSIEPPPPASTSLQQGYHLRLWSLRRNQVPNGKGFETWKQYLGSRPTEHAYVPGCKKAQVAKIAPIQRR
jgi:hypothetical protein